MTDAIKRILSKDIKELHKLELEKSGIHIEFNEQNMLEAKAIIIGPKDTPYENGILFFKIKFPLNYPYSPPIIKYYSYSKIRIHPNLYVGVPSENFEGKVCLSIINTWSGPKWTTIMHIGSVLLSIASMLDEHPLRNEPGYEDVKLKYSNLYNQIIEHEKYKHLILDNGFKYGEDFAMFREIISKHLKDNKMEIIRNIETLHLSYPSKVKIKTSIYGIKTYNIDYSFVKNSIIEKFDNI